MDRRDQAAVIPKPRRLRTAYAYFVSSCYHRLAKELGSNKPQPIIRRLGEMWRKLPENDRQMYVMRENRDRLRYMLSKQDWVRQHAGRPLGYLNRKRRERGAPKRPRSSYLFFRSEMAAKLRDEMPDAPGERDREVIRRWHALDEKARRLSKEKAKADRVRFATEKFKFHAERKAIIEQQRRRLEQLRNEQAQRQQEGPNEVVVVQI